VGGEGMNIDKTSASSFIQSYQKQMHVSQVEKTRPIQREDQLQISNQAKDLFVKNNEVDVERQDKINTLKAQIQTGEYQVNNEKVADKVLQFWFGQ
jgi:negative regulator of flagellin synthesis FlgM